MVPVCPANGKPLNFTRHALEELEESDKNGGLCFEILERGAHDREGKKKPLARMSTRTTVFEVVYIERDVDVLIVHLRL